MIKVVAVFLISFAVFYFGIEAVNRMTKVEKWEAAKTFSYALIMALVTWAFLISIVVLF
jgi:hypothetical protein